MRTDNLRDATRTFRYAITLIRFCFDIHTRKTKMRTLLKFLTDTLTPIRSGKVDIDLTCRNGQEDLIFALYRFDVGSDHPGTSS
jgi:hypothetical protein